jgi:AcrR family transcriptional regulator
VLDVASEYFLTHGYEGASINAMARSSGISKESIYRYFSSKKELFEAVIDRELVEYQERLQALDSTLKSTDLRGALIALSETVLGEITTDRMLALRRLIFEEATRSPCVGQHYYQIGPEQAYARLETMFGAHLDDAEFDARSLSRHFVALLSHRVMLARECRVQSEPTAAEIKVLAAEIVGDFLRAFLRGI